MPGQGANAHIGYRRHTRICKETTWGSIPDPHVWYDIPILEDGYKLRATGPKYRPKVNIGGYKQKVSVYHQQVVEGTWSMLLWPFYASFMLDAALKRGASHDLDSFFIQYYAPHQSLNHGGVVVDSLSIEADGESGVVTGEFGLVGKSETENETLLATDFDYDNLEAAPYMFNQAVIELPDDTEVCDVDKFTLTINNNVKKGPFVNSGGSAPGLRTYLMAGPRRIELTLTELADRQAFMDARLDASSLSFVATFTEPGGEVLVITLPALDCDEDPEEANVDEAAKVSPKLIAMMDDSDNDITYSESGTTGTETETGTG